MQFLTAERIKPGDTIYDLTYKLRLVLEVSKVDNLVELKVAGGFIRVTAEHLFFVKEQLCQ